MTIIEMAGDETEITVNKIKARMEDELLPQIKAASSKEESIGAISNTAFEDNGGWLNCAEIKPPWSSLRRVCQSF